MTTAMARRIKGKAVMLKEPIFIWQEIKKKKEKFLFMLKTLVNGSWWQWIWMILEQGARAAIWPGNLQRAHGLDASGHWGKLVDDLVVKSAVNLEFDWN